MNIVAGNGYFDKKKKAYAKSRIAITNAIGTCDMTDWDLDSIMKRNIRVSDEVIKILSRWNNDYRYRPVVETMEEPTAEDLAQIEEFKKKGWIN